MNIFKIKNRKCFSEIIRCDRSAQSEHQQTMKATIEYENAFQFFFFKKDRHKNIVKKLINIKINN